MINQKHWNEWKNSGVDNHLIDLNVVSLNEEEAFEYLIFGLPRTERRNDGRLRDKWLRRYAHLVDGGWWVSGLDPFDDWNLMEWGRLKPNSPRLDFEKNKAIRYESPPKVPNRVTYFNVPAHLWNLIARRYGLELDCSASDANQPDDVALKAAEGRASLTDFKSDFEDGRPPSAEENPQFWKWLQQNSQIPIILTEGEKKAASLLSLGFVAIAKPGIWGGRVGKDIHERLHPDLMAMAQAGRKFIILFDYETKPKTQYAVYQATVRTARAIKAAGCDCEIALLPGPQKGVDDFIVAHPQTASSRLEAIIDDALSPQAYQLRYRRAKVGKLGKYKPHVKVNVPYLSEAVRLPESGLVVLKSDMGTGKTELMRLWRQEHPQWRFLNNGHRINLLKNLSKRLGTAMYSAIKCGDFSQAAALSITVDSLHKLTHAALTYDCLFIDEAVQYLVHLLHSQTCKEFRAEILEVLEYLVGKAKLVVIGDAHMDETTINFFAAMRPHDKPFIIENSYKSGGRPISWHCNSDSSGLVAEIFAALLAEQKIMVVSDSKRFIKKLEASMCVEMVEGASSSDPNQTNKSTTKFNKSNNTESNFNQLKIWSVHSENSGSEENVAFIEDISEQVKGLDALLASPSLGTGVDLPHYHFDLVFGVFHGVSQSANECAQALHRYRPHVPMQIWVAPHPPFGYKPTNPAKIKQRILESNQMTAFLIRLDKETGVRGAEKDWALDAYCEIVAARNDSINNLSEDLRLLLEQMGHTITNVEDSQDKASKQRMKQAGATLDAAYYQAVANADEISRKQYQARQTQDYLTDQERYECEKYRISRAYGLTVTEDLVELDQGGRLIGQLVALEAVLSPSPGEITDPDKGRTYPLPPERVKERDLTDRELFPLATDWSNYSSQWLMRQRLGLPKILARLMAGEELAADDPDLVQMHRTAIMGRAHVKAILGFNVSVECSPMWLLGMLLDQLGLKLVSCKRGPRGGQVRFYSLMVERLYLAMTVLAHRERQRQEQPIERADEGSASDFCSVDTPPSSGSVSTLKGGVDTLVKGETGAFGGYLRLLSAAIFAQILAKSDCLCLWLWRRWPPLGFLS